MENIRITSGKYRGQSIESPKSTLTHPMGSREKLALFNMIVESIPGANVLDAFAGSGALGIEAFSRGAKNVDFIEKSPRIAKVTQRNCQKLNLETSIFVADINNWETDNKYDVIIADPPYNHFDSTAIINLTKYLKNGGKLVLSHPSPAPVISTLNLLKTKKYAKANISIYQKLT